MSGRRARSFLLLLAGASLAAAIAVLFLHDGDPAPLPPPPAPEDVIRPSGHPAVPVRKTPPPVRKNPDVPPPPEDDSPPTAEKTTIPADWTPWARLKFVDAKTREAIPFKNGTVGLVIQRADRGILMPEPFRRAADGRIEVFRTEDEHGIPPGTDRAGWASSMVEVRIRGYEMRRFASRAELSGDRDVELTKAIPSVKGTLRLAPALRGKKIRVYFSRPGGFDLSPPRDSIVEGPFEWFDLDPGAWKFIVHVGEGGEDSAVATRDFMFDSSPADLGEILVMPPSILRARVVARDGQGVLDKDLTLRHGPSGRTQDSEEFEDDGWVIFRGLEPDTEYRVVSVLDKLEGTIRTPAEGGGDLRLEIPWEHTGVRCRIRFTVDGQDPIQWGEIFEGPTLDKGAWKRDGFLEHDMAPGDYFFGIHARPVGKAEPVRVSGKFTVPDRPLFDLTVDLKETK
jgi:hypothetical protein